MSRLLTLDLPLWQRAVYVNGLPVNKGTAPIWGQFRNVEMDPPAIGERIKVRINNLGNAVVTMYFIEGGYLGVCVKYDSPPDWLVKQCRNDSPTGHLFGPEIMPLETENA